MSRVLIACEFSGRVRDAFAHAGHNAVSCDLLPCESPGFRIAQPGRPYPNGTADHVWGDVSDVLGDGWDLMVAFPPCTHLASSGARWFKDKAREQEAAIEFVRLLAEAPIERIAIENPIGVLSTRWRKPDQIVQPWMFGHGETKATCLWLKGLPKLVPTNVVEGRHARVHREPPGPERWKNRSRTLPGFARAMADQWGTL